MSLVQLERDGPVGVVTLARPAAGNALVPELLDALIDAVSAIGSDTACRAALLRAEGDAFSLGGDMRRFAAELAGEIETYGARLVGRLNDAILALAALPQPVVAAVHGPVTGGALGLVLASDLVFVSPRASFKAHYATAGFAPDGGWSAILPGLAGRRRAAACLFTNRTISAQEAVSWGIANELVAEGRLEPCARQAAARIARYPAGSMRAAKRLLGAGRTALAQALEAEREEFVALIAADEARQGVAAFLESFAGYPRGDAYSDARTASCS